MRKELDFYCAHVEDHFKDFQATKSAWLKVVSHVKESRTPIVVAKQK
ncbi:MAG: hypothetical protein ACRCW1_01975 [Anaerotignaceae bacterium]